MVFNPLGENLALVWDLIAVVIAVMMVVQIIILQKYNKSFYFNLPIVYI